MPQLVIRTRSGRVDSIHDGFICITDPDRNIIGSIGDPEAKIFLRSSVKPFLAVAFVQSGAMEKYDITLKELAVICSSHSGQDFHLKAVRSILKKIGLSEKELRCGHKDPESEKVKTELIKHGKRPDSIYSCCSGKHAGMLALCRTYGYPIEEYTKHDHPVQELMKKTLADILECDINDIITGKDGCTIPTYLLSMHQASFAYSLLASGYEGKGQFKDYFGLIQKAMITYPRMINGDDKFCTDLIEQSKGRAIGKLGAEGVYMVAVPEKHLGISINMSDGHPWASYPTAVHVLEELGILDEQAVKKLEKWALPPIRDDMGEIVGYLHPTFSILNNRISSFKPGDIYPSGS